MKLHLGCGKVNIPGFYNIDLSDYEHIDLKADIKDLNMFNDNSVDLIYVSAVFQYFDRQEGFECLKEWYRILKIGGKLRISTVDFNKLLDVYRLSNKDLTTIVGPLYGRMDVVDRDGSPTGKIYHKTVYTSEEIGNLLNECGFKEIVNYDWREHIHNDYDDQSQSYFPHMEKENGIHIMQNVQAIK
jgi:predicted SAM-dependent methyltransferase